MDSNLARALNQLVRFGNISLRRGGALTTRELRASSTVPEEPKNFGAVLISGVAPGFSPASAALKGGATFKLGQHQKFVHSLGATVLSNSPISFPRASISHVAALRSRTLSLEKNYSIGFKSGE
jgi:hypothetical protein